MRLADVSQLPVLDDGESSASSTSPTCCSAVHADAERFRAPVASAMTDAPRHCAPDASLDELRAVLDRGQSRSSSTAQASSA